MKKIFPLLALATIAFTLSSNAQIEKGTVLLGGNLSLSSISYKSDNGNKSSYTSFSIMPSFAKAYAVNKVFGVSLGYANYVNYNAATDPKPASYTVAGFLRQYKPLGKGFYVFAQEGLSVNYATFKTNVYDVNGNYNYQQDNKLFNTYLSFNPGFAFDLSKKVQLELQTANLVSLGYSNQKIDASAQDQVSHVRNFYLNSNFDLSNLSSVNVGVRILLGRK